MGVTTDRTKWGLVAGFLFGAALSFFALSSQPGRVDVTITELLFAPLFLGAVCGLLIGGIVALASWILEMINPGG